MTMTNHAIRVPDELWQAAIETARRHDQTVSKVVRRALAAYVEEGKR